MSYKMERILFPFYKSLVCLKLINYIVLKAHSLLPTLPGIQNP